VPYGVRVRNTANRGGWGGYVKAAREAALLSQSELARRLRTDRTTVWRWEAGRQTPENAGIVADVARELNLDVDEALAAAGLRPGVEPPAQPTVERDEEVELILSANISDKKKTDLLGRLFQLREQDRQRRDQTIRWMIDEAEGA
jgi:transcriptional regulator with XRE-family HTH domain